MRPEFGSTFQPSGGYSHARRIANNDDCREVLWDRLRVKLLRRETVDQDKAPCPEPVMEVNHAFKQEMDEVQHRAHGNAPTQAVRRHEHAKPAQGH